MRLTVLMRFDYGCLPASMSFLSNINRRSNSPRSDGATCRSPTLLSHVFYSFNLLGQVPAHRVRIRKARDVGTRRLDLSNISPPDRPRCGHIGGRPALAINQSHAAHGEVQTSHTPWNTARPGPSARNDSSPARISFEAQIGFCISNMARSAASRGARGTGWWGCGHRTPWASTRAMPWRAAAGNRTSRRSWRNWMRSPCPFPGCGS